MLARHCAVELQDEIADRMGDGDHFMHLALFLEIDERANVHAADGAVAIVTGNRVVTADDLAKTFDELGQLRGLDRSVFNERNGLLVAPGAEQKSEPGFAQSPDR